MRLYVYFYGILDFFRSDPISLKKEQKILLKILLAA